MQQARGKQSVAVGGDAGVVVTGDHNQVVTAPPVRSAYWEQVRRIAPAELVDREEELAALSAFCRADSGPAYTWWRAEAWAGKTALLSWFALNPPEGVRIVPFFITARLGAQNDVVAYVDVVLEQLAELAGEGLPALLTAATREAHLLRLYGEAAQACAERGERLVLLVDGLDEDRGVTTGPDAHSIASLLPYDLPVIVSGRLNPPLPVDVPAGHPLHDPAIVRILDPSPYARAIRAEAERELKRLLAAGGVAYDLLGLLLAAGGGLTADDLAELTGEVPYRVRDVLRTGQGRTFAVRSGAYLLAHEELQAQAREMLGERELDRYRGVVCGWAEEWRSRGWPVGTPEYLLRGWFPMLRAAGDLERMVACATDAVRQDRMVDVAFGDFVALGEIRMTEDLIIAAGVPELLDSVRLAVRRDALEGRNARVDVSLPHAWAACGHFGRAEALALSIPEPVDEAYALVHVAEELIQHGDPGAAVRLIEVAEKAARGADSDEEAVSAARERTARAWLRVGSPERADSLIDEIHGTWHRERLLPDLAQQWVRAGEYARAEALAQAEPDPGVRTLTVAAMAGAWAEVADVEHVRDFLSAVDPEAAPLARVSAASVLLAAGRRTEAEHLAEGIENGLSSESPVVTDVIGALARAGWCDRALALAARIDDTRSREGAVIAVVRAMAAAGEYEEAMALAFAMEDTERCGDALLGVVVELADAERCDEAESLARRIPHPHLRHVALCALVGRLADTGEFDRAEALARECGTDEHDPLCGVVEALAAAGEFARAEHLARTIDHDEGLFALVRGVAVSVDRGARAAGLLATVEAEVRVAYQPRLMDLVGYANVLVDAGHDAAALPLVVDAEAQLPDPPGPEARDVESYLRDVMVGAIADLYARIGMLDRAEALLRSCVRVGHEGWPSVVEAHARAGNGQRLRAALEVLGTGHDGARSMMCPRLAAAGEVDLALALAETVESPDEQLQAWSGMAAVLAAAGEERQARAALAEAEATAPSTYMRLMTSSALFKAYVRLGQNEKADRIRARMEADADSPPGLRESLVRDLVELGQYDRAEELVERAGGPSEAAARYGLLRAFVTALVDAGEHERAARAAPKLPEPRRGQTAAWVALAPVVERRDGRVLAARILQVADLRAALPAALRLEPRAVPVVVDALRRPRQV
ncbi:hypothetical protein ACFYV5_16910 [Streptomyces sp. NPDC003035]|uniref:hypothetical protein n=1 Tax=Streptomyces sp. NPDC003035 TaxID=3364676 RepID=UPI0036C3CB63